MGLGRVVSPRMAWVAAMTAVLALVVVAVGLIVDSSSRTGTNVTQGAAGGESQATGTTTGAPDVTSGASEDEPTGGVDPDAEPRDLCNTTPPRTADPSCPGYVETTVAAAVVTTSGTGPTEEPLLCDTTPPLTADPSCPGYIETTLPTSSQVTTGTRPPPPSQDGCGQHPGISSTTTAPPHCTGSTHPMTTETGPGATTDICDPSAVSTTHPSCVGDPDFCGAITTVPTCPSTEG